MSDPGNYRTRAEIEKYQERDPIKLFSASLKEQKIVNDERLERIDKEVQEEVAESVKFAEESPLPPPEDLYTDIYANPIDPSRRK
jgi:pyruvate dehydrogenase E1 component subunit alpha